MKPLLVMNTDAIYETIHMTNMAYLVFSYDGENLRLIDTSPDITYESYQLDDDRKMLPDLSTSRP